MKTCKKCQQAKPLTEFYAQPANKDGRQGTCKKCMGARTAKWYQDHPEAGRLQKRKRLSTPEGRRKHNLSVKMRQKPYIKYRADKCRRCGFVPENICQLTVDHIDSNHDNNDVTNLQTLCHNCHNLKSWIEKYEAEKLLSMDLIPPATLPPKV